MVHGSTFFSFLSVLAMSGARHDIFIFIDDIILSNASISKFCISNSSIVPLGFTILSPCCTNSPICVLAPFSRMSLHFTDLQRVCVGRFPARFERCCSSNLAPQFTHQYFGYDFPRIS